MSTPTIVALGPAAACLCSWIAVGALVPARWLPQDGLQSALTRFAVGTVAWSLGLLAAGRLGGFSKTGIIAVTVPLAVVGLLRVLRWSYRVALRLPPDRVVLAALALVAVALLVDIAAATAPPTSADALKYHLALPRRWLQLGSIGDPFWVWEGFQPSGLELLYGQALAIGNGSAAGAIHAFFAAATAACVYGIGKTLGAGSRRAGAIAAGAFVLQGLVTWEATSSFVELGLAFYTALALWYALGVRGAQPTRALAWCGFAAGAAAGTKFLGVLAGGLVVAGALVAAPPRLRARGVAVAGLAAVGAGGAWYLKNGIVTGNPVYPAFFGGTEWTPYAQTVLDGIDSRYGTGSILRLPILPLDLLLHGGSFDRGEYVSTASFLLAPFALLARRRLAAAIALAGIVVYVAAWWELTPQARFLLPALVVLACLAGVGATELLTRGRLVRAATAAVLAAGVVAWIVPSVALVRQLVRPVVGAEAKAHFLDRLTGTQRAFDAIGLRTDGGVAFVDYEFVFNFPGRAFTLGPPAFGHDVPGPVYRARALALGARYLVTEGSDSGVAPPPGQLGPCARRLHVYPARFVTSRSKGTSVPITLTLYSLARCSRPPAGS